MKKTSSTKNFEFILKTKTKFGVGEALNLGKYLKEMSFKRIGIIIDSGIFDLKNTKEILKNIQKEKFDKVKIWKYDLKGEPDYDSLDRIKLLFLDNNSKPIVDCFVGIGGGSVIDFAKGLATLMNNPGKAVKYRGFPVDINPSLPIIALPTTAGTGSEVTFNAVFIDLNEKRKLGINTRNNFPALAILDPILTLTCPKKVAIASGMDTLVHVIEGYASLGSTPFTKIFAKDGFKLTFNNLSKILDQPKNIEVRANLQLGAYFGGLVLLGSGGGPPGPLSYILGVRFKVPHGIAGAVILPHIVEYNIGKGYDYSKLYDLIQGVDKCLSKKEKNKMFSKKLFALCKKTGVPSGLKTFGVNKDNVGVLTKDLVNYEKAFLQNPTPFSVEDGKKLLTNLINK